MSDDLGIIDQYDFILKADVDLTLYILALRRSSDVEWASYVDAKYPFMGYNSATWKALSLAPSRVGKHHRFDSDALVFVRGLDVVWLPDLAYASMESCQTDWLGVNGEIADIPAEVGDPSVDVPVLNDLVL